MYPTHNRCLMNFVNFVNQKKKKPPIFFFLKLSRQFSLNTCKSSTCIIHFCIFSYSFFFSWQDSTLKPNHVQFGAAEVVMGMLTPTPGSHVRSDMTQGGGLRYHHRCSLRSQVKKQFLCSQRANQSLAPVYMNYGLRNHKNI